MKRKNILSYLEETEKRFPNKLAFVDEEEALNFKVLLHNSKAIGTSLAQTIGSNAPIIVFMKRSPKMITAFFGVIYSGSYYIPIDAEMPKGRIDRIIANTNPKAIIYDDSTQSSLGAIAEFNGECYHINDLISATLNEEVLLNIRNSQIDRDPIYIVFTSGSTGNPKGVTANHQSVIDYIEGLVSILEAGEGTVFGSQTPLYFDACLKEVITTIKCGATTYLIPKMLFMFPLKLVEYLNTYKINTICWVSSALVMISSFGVLDKKPPKYLHTIAFGSEVFPVKQLNLWREALPNAKFINLYGPTECTGMSCFYIVEKEFSLNEVIPIGKPFPNRDVFLLNENNNRIDKSDEIGEICIRGAGLTLGYYNDFEKTNEVFTQNPLHSMYPELIYRTGDLGKYNKYDELLFVSRKDYQIKHMGHRIELGEIEMNMNSLPEIKQACCVYDEEKNRLVGYYVGVIDKKEVIRKLKELMPRFMIPNRIIQLEDMPYMANGKINRVLLKENSRKKRGEK